MATVISSTLSATPRRALVPADDPSVEVPTNQAIPPAVDGRMMLVKAGDIIDIGMDWLTWCKANDGVLASSAWASHGSTPQAPTLGADGIDATKQHTVVQLDTTGAAAGDTYYIKNTVTITDATAGAANTYDLPTRTLTRVLHVRVTL